MATGGEKVEPLVANATPTRWFFVDMLTRDISLQDCILDLIDNCLDGARRSMEGGTAKTLPADAYEDYSCSVTLSRTRFEIKDNCGGIPIDIAEKYAFRFGRDPRAPKDKYGVGIYGIGMKRAIFKIGNTAAVHSVTDVDAFKVAVDVTSWAEEKGLNWNFPIERERKGGEPGTKIEITDLNDVVAKELEAADFEIKLIRIISRDYSVFLQKGFGIHVNRTLVKPDVFELRSGKGFEPARIRYRDEGVDVEIFAGMGSVPADDETPEARPSRDMALSGWYVICNDRTVIAADKSETTLWGYAGVAEWHPQYNGFLGVVTFRSSDPDKLPWTTTKRDIDVTSELYKRALRKMRELTKTWTAYTNRRKGDIPAAKAIEKSTIAIPLAKIPERQTFSVPKAKKLTRTLANISYQQPSAKVDKVREALGSAQLSNREVGESALSNTSISGMSHERDVRQFVSSNQLFSSAQQSYRPKNDFRLLEAARFHSGTEQLSLCWHGIAMVR